MKRWVPKHKTHFYVVSGVESLLAADIVSLVVLLVVGARVVVSCVCWGANWAPAILLLKQINDFSFPVPTAYIDISNNDAKTVLLMTLQSPFRSDDLDALTFHQITVIFVPEKNATYLRFRRQIRRRQRVPRSSTSQGRAEPLCARINGANRQVSEGKADV